MSDHEDETITAENVPPKNIPQIITVTNIYTKFPYLKKGEYDIWAMKMNNFISSSDLLCWIIALEGNSAKFMKTNNDGNLKIRPPITAEEHQQVQREEKARTIMLSALPDEHMGEFYHMIDARDIWNAIKARFGENVESKKMQKSLLKQKFEEFKISEEEGLDKGYDKIQKILTQMKTLKIKPGPEDINMKFLRGLPFFGLIDTKGYSSSSPTLSNAAFVSTTGSSQGNLSYQELRNGGYGGYTTTLSASPGFSSSKASSKSKCSVVDDVHRFEKKHRRKIKFNGRENARFDKKLVKCFNCKQMGHFSREYRAQGAQTSNNYQKYKSKEARKDGSDSKAIVVVDGSIDWDKQTEESNTEPRSLENFGMITGIKLESGADSEGEVVSADAIISADVSISAGLVAAAAVSPQSKTEFALMGLSTEDSMTKLDNELANQAKWNNSGKNLYKLIDNSMSVRTKRGLGLDKYIGEGELGIDDSVFSIFHTTSDDLKGQPIYNRFASVNHIKTVPPPLTGNYMPPFNIPDIDESQMVYGKMATDSFEIKTNDDSISHSHDFVLFYFSDSVSAPASASSDTIVIDCARQEDFPSVCTSSIKTDVKSSKTFYLHLIKDCDFHEQTFAKRNVEGKVSAGQPYPVSVGQSNPVSVGQSNPVSVG
uniref:Ribonuclease H-like domain-containing protein n=1 Tax=Tanacetum cinerariifolium TaxID=118510 RepID=A0A699IYX5_TANCI|nr:ribonuclease H-like domain-containing protein [Tanacetum cinerariifolium]